jgi:hypothetical protein
VSAETEKNPHSWGLFRKRQCPIPTWRGCLLLVLISAVLIVLAARRIHPFLAVNAPVQGEVLVVEGWAADYVFETAIAEFKQNHYQKVLVTGGPLQQGAPLSEYKTYAELGAATLLKLGLSSNIVQAVPAPLVRQDRTYTSALTLKTWWAEHGLSPRQFNLLSVGPHARRSRLLFEKAFGNDVKIGILAIPEKDYDPKHWWRSSAGVRAVISETVAYGYVRIFFKPPKESGTKA